MVTLILTAVLSEIFGLNEKTALEMAKTLVGYATTESESKKQEILEDFFLGIGCGEVQSTAVAGALKKVLDCAHLHTDDLPSYVASSYESLASIMQACAPINQLEEELIDEEDEDWGNDGLDPMSRLLEAVRKA